MNAPITRVRLRNFDLPLRRPWCFAGHCIRARRGWLLQIEDADTITGWGEATPFPQIGTESIQVCRDWLDRAVETLPGQTPEQALATLESADTAPPAGRCGLENALLDLQARRLDLPLARLLHPEAKMQVAVHAALGDLDAVGAEDLEQAAEAGFRHAKIKLGASPAWGELPRLQALLSQLPDGLQLRLDANRAWDQKDARDLLTKLDPGHIDLLEEPLAQGGLRSWQTLQQGTAIPLALDESLDQQNLGPVLESAAVRYLVLKPMRLGGLLPCLDIARRAGRCGIRCLVTTTLDGAPATAAAAHLAAAVDAIGSAQVHGLATSGLLARDLADPLLLEQAQVLLPESPGLGLLPVDI